MLILCHPRPNITWWQRCGTVYTHTSYTDIWCPDFVYSTCSLLWKKQHYIQCQLIFLHRDNSTVEPEQWPKWIERFDPLDGEEVKVNTLLYSMGQQAEDIMLSFNLSADNAKKYSVVKQKPNDNFVVRRNGVSECAKFNRRAQGQTVLLQTYTI